MSEPDYYKVLTGFMGWPKTNDITLDFFGFLEQKYPDIWVRLNMFYADDYTWEESGQYHNPRLALFFWDDITEVVHFPQFLASLKKIWPEISGNDYGECSCCKEEAWISVEHRPIVTYELSPMFKVYEDHALDGSMPEEKYICRNCAIKMLKIVAEKAESEKETFWV